MPAASFLGLGFDDGTRRRMQFCAPYQLRIWPNASLILLCLLICLATTLSAQGAVIQSEAAAPRNHNERVLFKHVTASEQVATDTSIHLAEGDTARNETRIILKQKYLQLLAAQNSNGNLAVLQRVSLSGPLSRLRQKLISAIRYERSLAKFLKHKHPDLIQARAEISAIQNQFASRLRPLIPRAKAEWQAAEAAVITNRPRPSIEAARPHQGLTKDAESPQSAEQNTAISESAKTVANAASKPDLQAPQQSSPLQKQNFVPVPISQPATMAHPFLILSLGLIAGLCLGFVSARFIEKFERRISSSAQLALISGHPVLSAIPRHEAIGLPAAWYHSKSTKIDAGPYSHLLSALAGKSDDDGADYRQAVMLLLNRIKSQRRPGRPHSILFLSPRAGVGNSAVTLSVAYAAALGGWRVLVVDATSKSPDIARAFSASLNSDGLIALDNKDQLSQIILCDASTGLAILPVALLGLDALTDAQRRRLVAGLNKISQNYDMICVDAGGLVADVLSNFLLDYADQIVLVARAHVTTAADVRQTMALIEPARSRISGAVLTYSAEVVR